MTLQAVIFDMDGVLYDSEPIHFALEQDLFRELGLSIGEAEHHGFVGTTSREMWTRLRDRYGLSSSVEELVRTEQARYLARLELSQDVHPVDGILPLVESLAERDIALAVASSAPMEQIELITRRFGIRERFAALVSGSGLPRSKPHPDVFLEAAGRLDVPPGACVVIEDAANGVEAARRAGMACVGFRNPGSGNQDLGGADLVVDDMALLSPGKLALLVRIKNG